MTPFQMAQRGIADIKSAIHQVLDEAPPSGLRQAEISKRLGLRGNSQKDRIVADVLRRMAVDGTLARSSSRHWIKCR